MPERSGREKKCKERRRNLNARAVPRGVALASKKKSQGNSRADDAVERLTRLRHCRKNKRKVDWYCVHD